MPTTSRTVITLLVGVVLTGCSLSDLTGKNRDGGARSDLSGTNRNGGLRSSLPPPDFVAFDRAGNPVELWCRQACAGPGIRPDHDGDPGRRNPVDRERGADDPRDSLMD
jgi:hypothetical protein